MEDVQSVLPENMRVHFSQEDGELVVTKTSKRNQKDKHHIDVVTSDSLFGFIQEYKEQHKNLTSYNATVRTLLEIARTIYEEVPQGAILQAVMPEDQPDSLHPGQFGDREIWKVPREILFR